MSPTGKAEKQRLLEASTGRALWKAWGPYLSERQWGTVREDYSADGNAWDYLPHDQARSRAYRWGEDGLAGLSDEQAKLCLGLALWNGRDPILKERLFGLTNREGNHGEDVKELYYYLDATPTHSYLRMLYKYPQQEFPYSQLVDENGRRGRHEPEYELFDTGVFDQDRYFDVFVEYAKAAPDDILMRVTVHNRGPETAEIHVLPQIWFRNTWSWSDTRTLPRLQAVGNDALEIDHPELGRFRCQVDPAPQWLFTENETNPSTGHGRPGTQGHFKDAFHEFVVNGRHDAVSPNGSGTKAAAYCRLSVPPRGAQVLRLRFTAEAQAVRRASAPFGDFEEVFTTRRREADEFYDEVQRGLENEDARSIQRQAFAGMIWSKQFYGYEVPRWLVGDPAHPSPPPQRLAGRNHEWLHLNNADVISMPDKWEYPWYAAWDLAFHCVPLAAIDAEFAKGQLLLLTREWYMHPNGQFPAYEWSYGDVNPPVHAWATWRVFEIDRRQRGDEGDLVFLKRVFHKLLLNYTWWVNRKDSHQKNIFQGGFLGLDNISLFDRNLELPDGVHLEQADGTAWMAMYTLNLMRMAVELAGHDTAYEDLATKFFENFLGIAWAINHPGGKFFGLGLWDEDDQFYYDKLSTDDGRMMRLKVRSLVGLVPLFAVETLEPEILDRLKGFKRRQEWMLQARPDLAPQLSRWFAPGPGGCRLLSLIRGDRMKSLLRRMLDETEFLSDYGVRALSREHKDHPYTATLGGQELSVHYWPGESQSDLFGGNSNWRGPVWFPVNFLIIDALRKFHSHYGEEFKVECPTGSGQYLTLLEVARELRRRLGRIFLRDEQGQRAVFGDCRKQQTDPHFRDYPLFYEYFHGDTGRGVGASHQTGWTGLIATLLQPEPAETGSRQTRASKVNSRGNQPESSSGQEQLSSKRQPAEIQGD
jgi:hypothetical protein